MSLLDRTKSPQQPSPEEKTNPNVRKGHSKKARVTAIIAGAALTAGGGIFVGPKIFGESASAQPEPTSTSVVEQPQPSTAAEQPVATASPEKNTGSNAENDIEALRASNIEALRFNPEGTPEEWAQQYTDILEDWTNSSANKEASDRSIQSDFNAKDFITDEAEKDSPLYAAVLFGPDYNLNEKRVSLVDTIKEDEISTGLAYFRSEDEAIPFKVTYDLLKTEIVSETDTEIVMNVTSSLNQNFAQNSIGELPAFADAAPSIVDTKELTFTKSSDGVIITGFDIPAVN